MHWTEELTQAYNLAKRLWANEPPVLVEKELPVLYDEPTPEWLGLALLVMPTPDAAYTFLKIWLRPEELSYLAQSLFYYNATGRFSDHNTWAAFQVFTPAAYQNHPIFSLPRTEEPHFMRNEDAIGKELDEKYGKSIRMLQLPIQIYGIRFYYDAINLEEISGIASGILKSIRAQYKDLTREMFQDILKFWSLGVLKHKANQEIIKEGELLSFLENRTEQAMDFLVKKYAYDLLTDIFKMAQSGEVTFPVAAPSLKFN